ncbi:hypothetical protein GCM10009827_045870 [Dactylosporangium maewongense]|uniref:Uncharacterized protein n=1 Tax=Dactylosporangium maewongense TaxID=634393 RepID=A0ABN2ASQ3_9ACTN
MALFAVLVQVLFGVGGPSERIETVLALLVPVGATVLLAPGLRSAVAVTAVLAVGLIALGVWASPPQGALSPPSQDWLLPYYGLVTLVCLVLLPMRVPGWWRLLTIPMLATAAVFLTCCYQLSFFVIPLNPSGGPPRTGVRDADFLSLPDELNVHQLAPSCLGVHVPCLRLYEVWSRHGAPNPEVMTLTAAALRDQGWPMIGNTEGASGCRPVRGVFTWADHCLSLHPTTEFVEPRQTTHPGAIVLWASSQ